jgi:hypothetical protein
MERGEEGIEMTRKITRPAQALGALVVFETRLTLTAGKRKANRRQS